MKDILKILQETGSFVDKSDKGSRGRPKIQGTWDSKANQISHEVNVALSELPPERGSRAQAIRQVADKRGIKEDSVKKALKRGGGVVTGWANLRRSADAWSAEIDRRTCRFPPTIVEYLQDLIGMEKLTIFLRENKINGDCPQWLLTAYFDSIEKRLICCPPNYFEPHREDRT